MFDGHISESSRPFLAPFLVAIVWCVISLWFAYKRRAEIPKVMQKIGSDFGGKRGEEDEKIKCVIKVSNTYFQPAKKIEYKLYKMHKSKNIFKCLIRRSPEIQDKLKRMPTESGRCMICCDRLSDAVLMDCGHGGICFKCGRDILKTRKECHMCRKNIKSLLQIKMQNKNTKALYYKVKQEIMPENEA